MSGKRDSPRRVTLAMMKGKPITTSVPVIRYHASDDELEEVYPSTDEEKRATPDMEKDKNSPRIPSSPAKASEKKGGLLAEDVSEEGRADTSLQEGTPPASDPWKVFSEIKGKITKTFEEKICEIKSEKLKKARLTNKENSSISDSEDLGDVTPSDENSVDKQQRKESGTHRRGISTHYVGFSRVKTGLKDKSSQQDDCVESGVEAAEYTEEVYEGVVFGLENETPPLEKPSAPVTSISGQGTDIARAPVQTYPVVSRNPRRLGIILSQLTEQLIYPVAYRFLVFVIISGCFYCLTPLPEYILGFIVGIFATVTFFNAVATVRKILVSLPDEQVVASQTVPVLEIPAVEEHAVVERFEGWLNELPYEYDPDNYHVARTKSVFFRLEGDILRIMETRMKIPKRAVWDEPKHKLKFTRRRAYCLEGAEVELLPQGLIRRRRWSKKYPICITLKKEALISYGTFKRSSKDNRAQHTTERNRRKAFRRREGLRRRRISRKDDDEAKRDAKAKQKEERKEDRDKSGTDVDSKQWREKRRSFIDDITENSLVEEDEFEEDDDILDCEDFDEELEQDEDDGDYEEEEDEDDDFEWEGELDDTDEVGAEEDWHDIRRQRSPMRTAKESKYSESEEGYEDARDIKMEVIHSEMLDDLDGNRSGKKKESEDDDKSTDTKSKVHDDELTDEKQSVRSEVGNLRRRGLKKFRDSQGSDDDSSEVKLFIFARADRQKEDWYRRLVSATTRQAVKRNQSPSRGNSPSNSNHGASGEAKLFTFVNHTIDGSSELSYKAYMAKYLDSQSQSPPDPPSSVSTDDILWFNGFIARILFDMHKCPDTISLIQDKIQRKLSNIKLPYFMECFLVSEIVIGQGAPVIRGVTKPMIDERGLWLDLDITYKGSLTMTVETKLNLMKLTRTGSITNNSSDMHSTDKQKPSVRSPMFDSDVEDTPETSTEDEDSAKLQLSGTIKENQTPSSGRKFLSMVDRIAANKYFQHATELSYVRRAMEGVSNMEIRLMVTVSGIEGCLSVNIPPAPADRLWYGFKPVPKISLTVKPAVGERAVNIVYVTKWIEAKLLREFEKLVVLPNMDDLVLPLCPNFPYMTTL